MAKEPVINTTAIRYGHGIVIAIHECDLMDIVAILDSGIMRRKIMLAHHREREENLFTELIEEQIRTGEELYNILEPMIKIPGKDEIKKMWKEVMDKRRSKDS